MYTSDIASAALAPATLELGIARAEHKPAGGRELDRREHPLREARLVTVKRTKLLVVQPVHRFTGAKTNSRISGIVRTKARKLSGLLRPLNGGCGRSGGGRW
jgi:hypothetical protein